MAKPVKIDDVKRPEKVTPATTSRPILVTNRPVLTNDPMVIADEKPTGGDEKPSEAINRTAKTIEPIPAKSTEPSEETPEKTADKASPEPTDETETKAGAKAETNLEEGKSPVDQGSSLDAKPEPTEDIVSTEEEPKRDSEAELNAEELAAAEAKVARDQEIEALIASGKYKVPINAVQRKRSHMYTMLLCLLAVILALLLLDAALDTGLVKLPVKLPHTHFFSTT